ncbi:MAG: hypothetical protein ACYCST_17410 [Acidimicrobiales bacterium]
MSGWRASYMLAGALVLSAIGAVAFAHTSGIVVATSYAGETATAAPTTTDPSGHDGVHHLAHNSIAPGLPPTVLSTPPPVVAAGGAQLRSSATSLGNPVAGEPVMFYVGSRSGWRSVSSLICSAMTTADGVASCRIDRLQLAAVDARGYTAKFASEPGFDAAIGRWSQGSAGR